MSYPKQLLRLQPKRGYISDTADHEASEDFYTQCENVQFRDGFAGRILGSKDAYKSEIDGITPAVTRLMHSLNAPIGDANWWLNYNSDGRVYAVQAGVATRIDNNHTQAVSNPYEVSSALINGLPIISDGQSEPVYWTGSGNLTKLPGWTDTESCKFIAVLKFHVFAMNISGPGGANGNLVKWSSATEPGSVPASWTPAADNDAGSVELADSDGPILGAYTLGDSLFIYKRSATYQARFVGGQNVFSFRKLAQGSTVGALTPRSVCDIGGAHFVVSDGGIYINDGTTRKRIGEGRVRDFLFNQLSEANSLNLFCTYNRSRDEALICFPSNGNQYATAALIYDLSRDAWGFRFLDNVAAGPVGSVSDNSGGNTWAQRTEFWQDANRVWAATLTSGAKDSLVLVKAAALEQQDLGVATALPALIGRSGLTFGEPERVKFVKRVHVRSRQGFGEATFRLGSQMTPNGPITWAPEVPFSRDESIINSFTIGRYIAWEIRTQDAAEWKLTGVDIEAELRGYY